MVKKVLPPLKEQNQVPNIASSGEWKSEDSTFLDKLAKGLKIGGEETGFLFCVNRCLGGVKEKCLAMVEIQIAI